MNKIIRKHYPASKLPHELRGDIPENSFVEVIVEEEPRGSNSPMDSLRALLKGLPKQKVSEADAVKRIRDLRNEWDD